jgi:hypothetical protein
MTTEIPENVLVAIKAVVDWYRGCDGPDEILEHDIPVIERWLEDLGLVPPLQALELQYLELQYPNDWAAESD